MKLKEVEPSQKELKDLKDKNNELAQHLQHWKSVTTEREREIRSLRKHLLHQKSINTALNRFVQKFIGEFNILSKNLVRFPQIIKEFTEQSALFDDAELERYSNIGCSPINNIQHVQPMVQGHSIHKPVITLARTVIDSRYTQPPTSVRESPPINVTEQLVAQPVMQLLESFVSLERFDSEMSRMSDENVTTRRPRQYQDGGGCVLNDSSILFDSTESVDESRDDLAMDIDRVNSDEENDGEVNLDNNGVSDFFRPGLAQIDEEDPNETDPISLNLLNGCSRVNNIVPMVLLKRSISRHSQDINEDELCEDINEDIKEVKDVKEVSEEVKETPVTPPVNVAKSPAVVDTYVPRPGPSWQSDSDEEERSGKQNRKKKKKPNKRNKKSKSAANDKENLIANNHQNSSDDDSDNSRYDAALNRMLVTKRAYDSLKPVKILVKKLDTDDCKPTLSDFAKTNGRSHDSTSKKSISADSITSRSSSSSIKTEIRNSGESDNTRPSSRSNRSAPKDYKEISIRKKLRRD